MISSILTDFILPVFAGAIFSVTPIPLLPLLIAQGWPKVRDEGLFLKLLFLVANVPVGLLPLFFIGAAFGRGALTGCLFTAGLYGITVWSLLSDRNRST